MLAMLALLLGVAVANPYGALRYETAWKEEITYDWGNLNHKMAFDNWKDNFGKVYTSLAEEGHRFMVFMSNWKLINDHNVARNHNYTMRLNQFGDLTSEEFRYYIHGHGESCLVNKPAYERVRVVESHPDAPAPDAIDWTNVNGASYVTPVKNQGQCGSCWAFSATGCTESAVAIKNSKTGADITQLSEQELVDCSGPQGNHGCNGGLMDYAFEYIQATNGLCSESEYAYTARDGTCKAKTCGTHYGAITGYKDVTSNSFSSLEAAVAMGPVSIAIEADQSAFQHYSSGVLTGSCGTNLDHGVLAVGYGTSGSTKYWKVKNSWGASWGMSGYILICKECGKNGNSGECGLLMEPSYDIAA